MSDVLAYQHSLPPSHFSRLCALPEVLARYSVKARGSQILAEIRETCYEAPADPNQDGNRLVDLDVESHESLIVLLRWAANQSEDREFVWLARELEQGAAESVAE